METTNQKKLQDLTVADLRQAYVGKAGKCCCGCSGKHYYTAASGESEGVNDAMVLKALRTIQANEENVDEGGSYFAADVGKKQFVVYLAETVVVS